MNVELAQERIEREIATEQASRVTAAIDAYETSAKLPYATYSDPAREDAGAVNQIASIVADGELLHITTVKNERHTINHRLKDLEQRLDPNQFIRPAGRSRTST